MFYLTVWQKLKCCRINNKWSISLVFRLLFSGFFQFVSAKQSLTHYLADLAHRSGLTLISTAGDFHSVDCYNQCLSWGNSIPSTVTRPQPSLPPPLHPISPAPGQASSNLPTHCTEIWGAQLSFSLSFLIHSFSLILVSTAVFICLLYSLSLTCSFPLIFSCLSQMLYFSPSQTHSTFFSLSVFLWLSFYVSLIIFLHLVPFDAISFSPILSASPSLSPLFICRPPSLSVSISSCSLHVSFSHLPLPAVLLLPQLVACWRALLHWVGWNLTWQVPRLWQEGKCIFWSLHLELTPSHFLWHWSEG